MVFKKNSTIRQVKKEIFKLFRPIIQGPPLTGVNRDDPNYSEDSVLEKEYRAFFETEHPDLNTSEGIENPLYKLQVYNNLPVNPGMILNYRRRCELCDREHRDNCDFAPDEDRLTLAQYVAKFDNRDLVLVAHWRTNP